MSIEFYIHLFDDTPENVCRTSKFDYYNGDGVKQNPTEAIKWLKLAADHGHPIALHYMGMVYYEGKILPQDYHRAITYFFIAEAQGIIDSSFMLGVIYYKGGGDR